MPDVNVLVYAHRSVEPRHEPYAAWLSQAVDGPEPIGVSVQAAAGFVRVVTMPSVQAATPVAIAIAFIEELLAQPRCRLLRPGPEHFAEVARLCRAIDASGNLVADAQHAAMAIEHGCTFVTADRDFARFAPHGLRWQHLEL